jgi:hypothetical protein
MWRGDLGGGAVIRDTPPVAEVRLSSGGIVPEGLLLAVALCHPRGKRRNVDYRTDARMPRADRFGIRACMIVRFCGGWVGHELRWCVVVKHGITLPN